MQTAHTNLWCVVISSILASQRTLQKTKRQEHCGAGCSLRGGEPGAAGDPSAGCGLALPPIGAEHIVQIWGLVSGSWNSPRRGKQIQGPSAGSAGSVRSKRRQDQRQDWGHTHTGKGLVAPRWAEMGVLGWRTAMGRPQGSGLRHPDLVVHTGPWHYESTQKLSLTWYPLNIAVLQTQNIDATGEELLSIMLWTGSQYYFLICCCCLVVCS